MVQGGKCFGILSFALTAHLVGKLPQITSVKNINEIMAKNEGCTFKIYKYESEEKKGGEGGWGKRRESGVVTWVTQEETK